MITKCYVVEMNSDNEMMFEHLNNFGFEYHYKEHWLASGYLEIYINCYYPDTIKVLEDIMQWYV